MSKAILRIASVMLLALPLCYGSPQKEPTQPKESLAEAARKVRAQKKTPSKPARVFTNDDLAASRGRISVLGTPAPAAEEASPDKPEATEGEKAEGAADKKEDQPKEEVQDEAYWRKRFAAARTTLRNAERELDILQRELNLMQVQHYSDPSKALREQYERKEITEHQRKIEDKRKEVEQLRQALSDLESELRRAGGNPGWAREP